MTNQKGVREILKDYHCWHTLIDCKGCNLLEICDEETNRALAQLNQCYVRKFKELFNKNLHKPHKDCLEKSKERCWCLNDCIEERDKLISDILKKLEEWEGDQNAE